MIPTYHKGGSQRAADNIWNETWNYALDVYVTKVNAGQSSVGDYEARKDYATYMQQYLDAHYPNSKFSATGWPNLNIYTSRPGFCLTQ